MVKISKNPGQCAGKKLFFFFYTKNGQNPGQCESRTLWNTVFKISKNVLYRPIDFIESNHLNSRDYYIEAINILE